MAAEEKPGIGHNSGDEQSDLEEILGTAPEGEESSGGSSVGGIAADQLTSYIERIERLEEEKSALQAYIREVYSEAKSSGFEPKIMRKVVRARRQDASDRREERHLEELYLQACGLL